jgi:hypothetical protein
MVCVSTNEKAVSHNLHRYIAEVEARAFPGDGGAAEKEAALEEAYMELWAMFGIPQRNEALPAALQRFPRGNSLFPLIHVFTTSMQIDAGPWPADGPNAPYDASADDDGRGLLLAHTRPRV